MEKIKESIIVGIICLAGFYILSFKLAETPPGIYVDEAVTVVNAYSILKTGKDEYGKSFPAAFRFFGSYSPPLYVYLTTIPVYFFGLNEFSIRITSVVLGSLMTIVVYGFLRSSGWFNRKISILLLPLFVITPWNFFYSRTGYEIYLGFFLFSLGTLFLWMGLKNKIILSLGVIVMSLATYSSHSQIYSAPLFLTFFIIMYFKELDKKFLVSGLIAAVVIQIPHLFLLSTKAFINKSDLFYSREILVNADKILLPNFISLPLSFLFSFFGRVAAYISPGNLFLLPDPEPQRSMPEISVFFSWMVLPYLAGLFVLGSKIKSGFAKFLLLLIITVVLPSSLTGDPFSTQRALGLLLPLFLIVAAGIQLISEKIKFRKFLILCLGLFVISVVLLWRSYFVLLPAERAVSWSFGYKELARIISENPDKTFIIDRGGGKPSYIELAFFLKTNPEVLQSSANPEIKADYYNLSEFNPDYKFGNIETRQVIWESDIYKPQVLVGSELLVSSTQAKDHFLTEMFVITDSRGYPVFKGFITDPQKKCRETNFNSTFCKKPNLNTMDQ